MDTITIILAVALVAVGGLAVFALGRGGSLRAATDRTNREIIRMAEPIPAGQTDPTPGIDPENQVDFRYSGLCLMLFLDGHAETQTKWAGIEELEGYANSPATYDPANRRVRIRELDKRIRSIVNP